MFGKKRKVSYDRRKVKFEDGHVLTQKHFYKNEAASKGGSSKRKLIMEGPSTSVNFEDASIEEKDARDDPRRGSIDSRRYSISSEVSERKHERRVSLSLPKEKKIPLKERRPSLSERRQSISSQSGGKTSNEAGGLSCTSSQASYTDDFINNLTKQKLNLQLKGVTDRMYEVCILSNLSISDQFKEMGNH